MALRVRAVTQFVNLTRDETTWISVVEGAAAANADLIAGFTAAGYAVQSSRVVTNPFGEYLDTTSSEAAVAGAGRFKTLLQSVPSPTRLRVALGEARSPAEIALVPALVRAHGDVANCCVNLSGDELGLVDESLVVASAAAVAELAVSTPGGAGNFNFTVNANVPPGCPFFPASYQASGAPAMFTIGLEYTDLLVDVLRAAPAPASDSGDRRCRIAACLAACVAAVDAHLRVLAEVATRVASARGIAFGGLDASAAPSKDCASITDVFALLGVPAFGAAGTLEAAALLTRGIFRALGDGIMPRAGFSGLMLACLEDTGLAAAAAARQFDLRALLAYSAVCGIGLDTVPVPGDTPPAAICALIRDTAALAFRLNKPLTVRLFPVPGKAAGEIARLGSDDLCDCAVFDVPFTDAAA